MENTMAIAQPKLPDIVLETDKFIHVFFDDRFMFINEEDWMQKVVSKIADMRSIQFTSEHEMIDAVLTEMIIIQNDALNLDEFVPKLCLSTSISDYVV